MLLPFVMALTLTTMAHCDAVGRGIHAINRAPSRGKACATGSLVFILRGRQSGPLDAWIDNAIVEHHPDHAICSNAPPRHQCRAQCH